MQYFTKISSAAPEDYIPVTTNLIFTNTSQQMLVKISVMEDTLFEDSEVFKVEISLVVMKDRGCVLLQSSVVDINILDNDCEFWSLN